MLHSGNPLLNSSFFYSREASLHNIKTSLRLNSLQNAAFDKARNAAARTSYLLNSNCSSQVTARINFVWFSVSRSSEKGMHDGKKRTLLLYVSGSTSISQHCLLVIHQRNLFRLSGETSRSPIKLQDATFRENQFF